MTWTLILIIFASTGTATLEKDFASKEFCELVRKELTESTGASVNFRGGCYLTGFLRVNARP